MAKRIVPALLCAALLLLLLPTAGLAEGPLSLIAVDDRLPEDLINTPAYYNGTVYVPAWLFTSFGIGLSYQYNSSTSVVRFTAGEKQLFFSLATGRTYDGDDYYYTAPATVLGGTVYVPLSFMCAFFGSFSYTNVGGNEYGTVLRIHTGREVLTDEEFLRLARPVMQRYYEALNPAGGDEPLPSPTPTDSPVTAPSHEGETVRLGLVGMPGSGVLELLTKSEMKACFFLTADEIRADPDAVRGLACEGFALGVVCPEGTDAEFTEASALLWEAARVPAVMALLPAGAEAPAGAAPVFHSEEESDGDRMARAYAVTAALGAGSGDSSLLFPCDEENETAFSVLIYFLRDQGFTVVAMRETDKTA